MEKAREGERGFEDDEPATYPTDGCGQRTKNRVERTNRVFIPQPTSLSDLSHFSLPAGEEYILFLKMSPKPISTLGLPRSTLLALSQAGYETTDELASSTPESLARGKSVCPGDRRTSDRFLMGIPSRLSVQN